MRREMMELLPLDFCAKNVLLPIDQFGSMLTLAVAEMPSFRRDRRDREDDAAHADPLRRHAARDDERPNRRGAKARQQPAGQDRREAPRRRRRGSGGRRRSGEPHHGPVAGDETSQAQELPEFDLPTVPLKLAGAMARNKPGAAPAPAPAPAGKPPAAGNKKTPAAALRWMDAAAKSDAPKPGETPKPNVSKYGGAAAVAPRAPAPAPATAAGVKPATSATGKPAGDGSWQAMFDVADESVKKVKPK